MRTRLIGIVGLLTACGVESDRTGVTVLDSAGIRIVENVVPAWDSSTAWRVDPEPMVEIGTQESTLPYELYNVVGGVLLRDGRIVIANSGTHELRWYSPQGEYLVGVGREGEGPGEFRLFTRVWATRGESLAVWDPILDRLSVFDAEGEFGRSLRLSVPAGFGSLNPVGMFSDGSIVGLGAVAPRLALREELVGRTVRNTLVLARFGPDGAFLHSLDTLEGQPRYVVATTGPVRWPYIPFAAAPTWAVSGNRLFVGHGDEFVVRQLDTGGGLTQIIRGTVPAEPVTSARLEALRTDWLVQARDENHRRAIERFFAETPVSERLPAYERFEIDAEGYLWVETFAEADQPRPRWEVFDPSGRWLGRVETPSGLTVLQIGRDFVLGRHLDDMRIERVQVYGLERTGS